MNKMLIAAVVLALCASAADSASRHKRYRAHHYWVAEHTMAGDPYAAFYNKGPKPPWAAPQQCFTEEGYGRYWPCGAGPNAR